MRSEKLNEIIIEKSLLDAVQKYNIPGGWEYKEEVVIDFKERMKEALYSNQNGRCAYCGLPLSTRNPEIDHIAPKGGEKRPKHTECIFLPLNLVYACHNCNSSECKGQKDVVGSKENPEYRNWAFKIVHPYLDDPKDYFECKGDESIILLPKQEASQEIQQKADFTIKLFNLNSEQKLFEVAKEIFFENNLEEIKSIVYKISTYRPYN